MRQGKSLRLTKTCGLFENKESWRGARGEGAAPPPKVKQRYLLRLLLLLLLLLLLDLLLLLLLLLLVLLLLLDLLLDFLLFLLLLLLLLFNTRAGVRGTV